MADEKFQKHRFITYLSIGLTLFVCWAGVNYYSIHQESLSTQQNVEMIVEEVDAIEVEQYQMMEEQLVIIEDIQETERISRKSAVRHSSPVGGFLMTVKPPTNVVHSASAPPPTPIEIDTSTERLVELGDKIAEREAIKEELLAELEEETMTLGESFKAMRHITKMDVKNPLVNLLILPLIGWVGKKTIDFGFKRLEEKYHHEA
jgi:hypothetical protein